MTEATDFIAEAITEAFGERCPEYAEGCPACDAWKQYDDLAALSKEVQASEAVGVKALEWEQNGRAEGSVWAKIDAIGRYYSIEPNSNVFELEAGRFLSEYGADKMGLYPTLESAKAAAQGHFNAIIGTCLATPQPLPATEERQHKFMTNGPGVIGSDLCTICGKERQNHDELPAPRGFRTNWNGEFDEVGYQEWMTAGTPVPAPGTGEASRTELIERLQEAIEGECEGLAVDEDQARAILEHIGCSPSTPVGEGKQP